MEKKEIGTATILNSVNGNTKFLGLEGGELAQIPFNSMPEATTETKGFMSATDKVSNPSNVELKRYLFSANIAAGKAFRVKSNSQTMNGSGSITVYGRFLNTPGIGVTKKVFSFRAGQSIGVATYGNHVVECSEKTCDLYYISDPFAVADKACIDIVNKNTAAAEMCMIFVELFASPIEGIPDQEPLVENLTKNNRDETAFVLKYGGVITDANLANKAGTFICTTSTINTPASGPYIIEVLATGAATVVQRLCNLNNSNTYRRISQNGGTTWGKYIQDAPGTVMNV